MPNWSGAASGAAGGAMIGSQIMPGWGTAGGAVLGGLMGLLSGNPDEMKKLETLTPEQRKMLEMVLGMMGPQGQAGQGQMAGQNTLMQLLNPSSEAYKKFEQPYMDQFNQQTVPGLAERFAGVGGGLGGGTSSSGFGQALSAAGGNLQNQLAGMKTSMQSQAANSLMQQFQNLFGGALGTQAFGYGYRPASAGAGPELLNAYGKYYAQQ